MLFARRGSVSQPNAPGEAQLAQLALPYVPVQTTLPPRHSQVGGGPPAWFPFKTRQQRYCSPLHGIWLGCCLAARLLWKMYSHPVLWFPPPTCTDPMSKLSARCLQNWPWTVLSPMSLFAAERHGRHRAEAKHRCEWNCVQVRCKLPHLRTQDPLHCFCGSRRHSECGPQPPHTWSCRPAPKGRLVILHGQPSDEVLVWTTATNCISTMQPTRRSRTCSRHTPAVQWRLASC
jgi:hypothetical protein